MGGKKQAILIGSDYELDCARSDAEKMKRILSAFPYSYECKKFLFTRTSSNADTKLESAFKEAINDAGNLLFYYAGHAAFEGKFYLHLTQDSKLPFRRLVDILEDYILRKGYFIHVAFIFDCCNAWGAMADLLSNQRIVDANISVLAACKTKGTEIEDGEEKTTFFAKILREALTSPNDCSDKNGRILFKFVYEKMKEKQLDNSTIKLFDNADFVLGKIKPLKDLNLINDRYWHLCNNLNEYWLENTSCYNVKTPYSSIDQVERCQTLVVNQIEDMMGVACKRFKDSEDRYFDAIQSPDFAYTNKAFYSFPFFLTPIRLSVWGVIPYAKHKALGLIYNKEKYPDIYNKCLFRHDYKEGRKAKNHYWITELISSVSRENGHICSISGYMFNEIIPLMINLSHNTAHQNDFMSISHIIHVNRDNVEEYKNKKGLIKLDRTAVERMIWDEIKGKDENVAIIDLASADVFQKQIWTQEDHGRYNLVSLNHYLNIPVGIGFSLLAFDDIKKKKGFWKGLRKIALETLEPCREELANIGIVLDRN